MQRIIPLACLCSLAGLAASAQEKKKVEAKMEILEDEPARPPPSKAQPPKADAPAGQAKSATAAKTEAAPAEAKAEPAVATGAKKGAGGDAGAKPVSSMAVEGEVASTAEALPPVPQGEEKQAIAQYIKEQTPDVVNCYQRRLDDKPTLQGKLYIILYIGPAGRVIGATTQGIEDFPLTSCILPIVRKWEFNRPQSGGKLYVKYPFVFKPQPRQ